MLKTRILVKTVGVVAMVAVLSTWLFQQDRQHHDSLHSIRQDILKLYSDLELATSNSDTITYKSEHSTSPATGNVELQQSPTTRKRVTPYDIDLRFCPKTLGSCEDDCQCADNLSNLKTLEDWETALKLGTIEGKPLFESFEYMFPWEDDYLRHPSLQDFNELPDSSLSKVWFLTHEEQQPVAPSNVTCKKRQSISYRVDLVNGYGEQRSIGGDEVRVWIEEDPSTKSGRRYSASGHVTDLSNGSYVVTVTPFWTGLTHLYVAVVYPREYIRAALHQARVGSNRFIFGMFRRDEVEEVTVCHATPNVPGRSCICNYTSWNVLPFYCGRPLDNREPNSTDDEDSELSDEEKSNRLTCNDWVSVWPASQPPFKHLTPAETLLAEIMSRTANDSIIKHDISFTVMENEDDDTILPACSKIDRHLTWEMRPPRGYWTKGPHWTSVVCHEAKMTPEWTKKCLRSTQVWLIGDSNVVRVRMMLCTFLSCKYVPHYTKWPESLLGINELNNVTVIFRPHEHPLYLRQEWMSLYLNGGVRKYLRSVPSSGNHIVIIHYYLHLASSHLSAFYYRLVHLRDSLQELFARNQDVVVGIRGPHVSTVQWQDNHMFGGDVLGTFMIRMLHEVMRDLKDRVVFLDGWEMSIGIRNAQLHPSNNIPTAMLRTMLAFKCT